MKITILGDIHGNRFGLEAVLNDIEQRGHIDTYWLLGDYGMDGGDPVAVLELLDKLPNTTFIRGNTDRYLTHPSLPSPTDLPLDRLDWLINTTQSHYWPLGALSQTRWLDWLKKLPLEKHMQPSDALDVLLVHSRPGYDDGIGLMPDQDDRTVYNMFHNAEENLIFVGHTHRLQNRKVRDKHIINTGCIGKPVTPDKRATYTILNVTDDSYEVQSYHVAYDTKAVIQHMEAVGFPETDRMRDLYLR